MSYIERIVVDGNIRFGKPTVKGTRIAVADVLDFLAAGDSEQTLLQEYPQLRLDDIRACLAFAADRERYTRVAG